MPILGWLRYFIFNIKLYLYILPGTVLLQIENIQGGDNCSGKFTLDIYY